jgi:lantibiotic modifying enzyme
MLYDPARHEPLRISVWDEARACAMIEQIVRDTEARFSSETFWPIHPRDADDGETRPVYPLYFGACGVVWALRYLEAVGAIRLSRSYAGYVDSLLPLNQAWLTSFRSTDFASYMMGDTGILLLSYWLNPTEQTAAQLEELIATNLDNPTRELMWGSPGTLLAALFLHKRTGEARWADLFRSTARKLWSQLLWSPEYECRYWTQDMYGQQSTYLDGVHGFVATASPLIQGRHLLKAEEWADWEQCIVNTVQRSATREGPFANWRAWLYAPEGSSGRMLMQFCHGAPGFVVCLADLPSTSLDELLLAGGEATWAAGPLTKGSNLCHGTGGNGYAFLKLYQRTQDAKWLERAHAFAMHAIVQTEADAARYDQLRYSLWTGDPGFAIYLWDCVQGRAAFPTLDVFFAG